MYEWILIFAALGALLAWAVRAPSALGAAAAAVCCAALLASLYALALGYTPADLVAGIPVGPGQ